MSSGAPARRPPSAPARVGCAWTTSRRGAVRTAWAVRPRATRPAARPAIVPSIIVGNTLFVPVEIGISGTSPLLLATARLVPSPPSVTMQPAPASARRAAARRESSEEKVTGIGMSETSSASRSPSSALSPMPKSSGMIQARSTPTASNPSRTRRTMLTFSSLSNTEPWATNRRMSRPEAGFAMMPTRLTGVALGGAGWTSPAERSSSRQGLPQEADRQLGHAGETGAARRRPIEVAHVRDDLEAPRLAGTRPQAARLVGGDQPVGVAVDDEDRPRRDPVDQRLGPELDQGFGALERQLTAHLRELAVDAFEEGA